MTGDQEPATAPKEEVEDRLLLVFVTATLVDPAGTVSAKTGGTDDRPATPGASAPEEDELPPSAGPPAPLPTGSPPGSATTAAALPYGVPVPGKPDFVTSPYAPKAGYVDVRGYTRGQAVRDPYTGQMFLVP